VFSLSCLSSVAYILGLKVWPVCVFSSNGTQSWLQDEAATARKKYETKLEVIVIIQNDFFLSNANWCSVWQTLIKVTRYGHQKLVLHCTLLFFSEDVELWSLMFYDFVLRCVQWLWRNYTLVLHVFVLLQKKRNRQRAEAKHCTLATIMTYLLIYSLTRATYLLSS